MEKSFFRDCPVCGKRIGHTSKKNRNRFEKEKQLCGSCAAKISQKRIWSDPILSKKLSEKRSKDMKGEKNPFYGKHHTKETIAKIQRNKDFSIYKTKEFKEKISKVTSGKNNPMYRKTYYDIWVEKYGKEEADKRQLVKNEKNSIASSGKNNPMYGKPSPNGSGNGWSGWYNGWFFRSLKELSYMINVIEKNNFKWRTAESRDLSIKYKDYKGDDRTYRADFLINEKTLVEVKPFKLFNSPSNLLKKEAAIIFCKKNNYEYIVVDIKLLDVEEVAYLYENKKIKFNKIYEEKYKNFILKGKIKNGNK